MKSSGESDLVGRSVGVALVVERGANTVVSGDVL